MKRWYGLLAAAICVTACSGSGTAGSSPRPAAAAHSPVAVVSPAVTPSASGPIATAPPSASSPAPPVLGVLVDLLSDQGTYTISLVSSEGQIVKQIQAKQRTPIASGAGHAVPLPYVSTSLTSLYYLDGDADLRVMHLDGSTGHVQELVNTAGIVSTFAVSPDDKQIAITTLDYTTSPVRLSLTVDNLYGGNPHVIFQSTSDYVWPVAWHSGLLVLAHAVGPFMEDVAKAAPGIDNPYSAISYHLVDPANANRKVLMGSCTVSGPLSPAGSGCIQGGAIDWQGNTAPWSTHDWGSISGAAALSPDGDWMAAVNPDAQTEMALWRSDGTVANYVDGAGAQDWAGWLDDQTIVVGSYLNPTWQPEIVNMVRGGIVHVIAAHGFFAGTLPTLID